MPGVWVFPGGAVDESDATPPPVISPEGVDDWRVAALREIAEETGIWLTTAGTEEHGVSEEALDDVRAAGVTLDADRLTYFANWITPEVFPIRFDTRFFLAEVNADTSGEVDGDELVDLAWVPPQAALDLESQGTWEVAFPTRRTLDLLATGSSASDVVDLVRSLGAVPPVEPRLYVSESEARILLPDDEGFDEAGPAQSDPTILGRLQDVVAKGGKVPAEFKGRS
jgi:8-oxo-dGTP pyrophosphatase MutT (NUDIX family)